MGNNGRSHTCSTTTVLLLPLGTCHLRLTELFSQIEFESPQFGVDGSTLEFQFQPQPPCDCRLIRPVSPVFWPVLTVSKDVPFEYNTVSDAVLQTPGLKRCANYFIGSDTVGASQFSHARCQGKHRKLWHKSSLALNDSCLRCE